MATMTYANSSGTLTWPAYGSWSAVSGGWGDPLPAGLYIVERRRVTGYTKFIGKGFKDKSGKGFFVPLTPQFKTNRTGLGIHPDGNVPGTQGCIGLKNDAHKFYEAIASTAPGAAITLQVTH
jgi:hypothetical protein